MRPIANIELTIKGLNYIHRRGRNGLDDLAYKQGRQELINKGLIQQVSAEKLRLAWDW